MKGLKHCLTMGNHYESFQNAFNGIDSIYSESTRERKNSSPLPIDEHIMRILDISSIQFDVTYNKSHV